MKRGDPPIFAKSKDLIVTTFQDSKRLSILSTVGNNTTTVKRIRDRKQPEGYRTVEKPTICQHYNDHMGGVDHFDQMKVSYSYPHKSVKWYHSVFHYIKEVALINGLICYRLNKDASMTAKNFRELVLESLIQNQVNRKRQKRNTIAPTPNIDDRLTGRHFPNTYTVKSYKPNCLVCKSCQKRAQTRYYCPVCNVPLCIVPCFELYHTAVNYSTVRQRQPQQ